MTYKEALEDMCMDCVSYPCKALKSKDHCYSYNTLIEIINKQMPKKPTDTYKRCGFTVEGCCSFCESPVLPEQKFCPSCGARIDWSEE